MPLLRLAVREANGVELMSLDELIERLEELRENYDGNTWEIKIAHQPSYPLLARLDAVSLDSEKQVVYIAAGSGTEYGVSEIWEDGYDLGEHIPEELD